MRTLADACALLRSRGKPAADAPLVGAGVGRFLARRLAARLGQAYLGLEALFAGAPSTSTGADLAHCAPAAAVARLAQEDGA